ncbi:MAG: glycosyltransferase family 2 protein [Labilithrix sp.]|nr:glycosyltransferase family 2 protein [Labilithrix sp.]
MKISVAIPVYKSEKTLPTLVPRLIDVISEMGHDAEIVCVDDHSPDGSWSALTTLKADHPALKIARLARNAGQHNAVFCALTLTTGDVVVTMDDDLQHPPEEVPKLVNAVLSGPELVIAAYEGKKHSAARNLGGRLVDTALRRIFKLDGSVQLTSFRAMSRALVERVKNTYTAYPYITALLLSHSGSFVNVTVRHEPRREGKSNYDLTKSLKLVLNLVLTYSSYPAILISTLCALVFFLLVGYAAYILYLGLVQGTSVPGWTSTILAVTFLNGLVLLGLALLSFYISRMYLQISGLRSAFSIERIHE